MGNEVISMTVSNNSDVITTVTKIGGMRNTTTSSTQGIFWNYGSNDTDYVETGAFKVYESDARASARLIITDNGTSPSTGPRATPTDNFTGAGLCDNETIRYADYSPGYGDGRRDIALVTAGGTNGGRILIRSSNTWSGWTPQLNANGQRPDPLTTPATPTTSGIDYLAVKFSPTYASDSSIVLVYADNTSTYYNIGYRDLNANTTLAYAFPGNGIEIKNPDSPAGSSPAWDQVNTVDLSLPYDFSGQSSSLRRAYISIDAYGSNGIDDNTLRPNPKSASAQDGIYRIDDITVCVLMDTSNNADKSIYSIDYYGTYASGKLLAGERMGYPCSATVPIWFTDSPTTCPIPCWYPAIKPPTGAANQTTCAIGSKTGIGAAGVEWSADGSMAYAATSSLADTVYAGQPGSINEKPVVDGSAQNKYTWWQMYIWDSVPNDESALSISRNNGETWNQLAIIDTTIDWFNDVAVAPDCTTIYLASANRNLGYGCNEFDSVWRASVNPNVTFPLPVYPPLGTYWERVYCRTTSGYCNITQSDLPILRVVPSCTDKADGEVVGWAAQGALASTSGKGGVMAWSPDFGDYWATVTPRYAVQDFAFESSTTLYTVNSSGAVQRLPYTGTSWSTNLPTYDTTLLGGHTIVAVPDGKVLVGANASQSYQAAYSADKGVTFSLITDSLYGNGNEHVIFDVDFKNDNFIYMGDDNAVGATNPGTVYRNTVPSFTRWTDNDMMSAANGGKYIFDGIAELAWPAGNNPPHPVGQFGLVQAWTGDPQPALYSAHAPVPTSIAKLPIGSGGGSMPTVTTVTTGTQNTVSVTSINLNGIASEFYEPYNSAVCRTLKPRDGMPKPGILWDCLDIFIPLKTTGVLFTLEPTSLKYCGCCTLDTSTTLYAIDDERGSTDGGPFSTPAGDNTMRLNKPGDGRWNAGLNSPAKPGYTPYLKRGGLWAYTDCLAKKGPILKTPADQYLVGADPVTGRNQQIDLAWEQLCLSTWYQLQVAKDAAFTLRVNPQVNSAGEIAAVTGSILLEMDETNMTSPATWLAPGALPEAGTIYYWRIRSAKSATLQVAASPWSEARSFTVKAGFIVNAPEINGQDIPVDRPAAFNMQPAPIPSTPPPAPSTPPPAEQPLIPLWAWAAIAIGAILVTVIIFLIYKSRHTY